MSELDIIASSHEEHVFLAGEQLEDDRTLSHYNIYYFDVIGVEVVEDP